MLSACGFMWLSSQHTQEHNRHILVQNCSKNKANMKQKLPELFQEDRLVLWEPRACRIFLQSHTTAADFNLRRGFIRETWLINKMSLCLWWFITSDRRQIQVQRLHTTSIPGARLSTIPHVNLTAFFFFFFNLISLYCGDTSADVCAELGIIWHILLIMSICTVKSLDHSFHQQNKTSVLEKWADNRTANGTYFDKEAAICVVILWPNWWVIEPQD